MTREVPQVNPKRFCYTPYNGPTDESPPCQGPAADVQITGCLPEHLMDEGNSSLKHILALIKSYGYRESTFAIVDKTETSNGYWLIVLVNAYAGIQGSIRVSYDDKGYLTEFICEDGHYDLKEGDTFYSLNSRAVERWFVQSLMRLSAQGTVNYKKRFKRNLVPFHTAKEYPDSTRNPKFHRNLPPSNLARVVRPAPIVVPAERQRPSEKTIKVISSLSEEKSSDKLLSVIKNCQIFLACGFFSDSTITIVDKAPGMDAHWILDFHDPLKDTRGHIKISYNEDLIVAEFICHDGHYEHLDGALLSSYPILYWSKRSIWRVLHPKSFQPTASFIPNTKSAS